MARKDILKIMELLNSFRGTPVFDYRCSILPSVLCQSILSRCNGACQPSKLPSAWCIKEITPDCLVNTNSLQKISSFFEFSFLPDPNDDNLLKQLLNETVIHYFKANKTKTIFCNNPTLFASSSLASTYNCTHRHLVPGSVTSMILVLDTLCPH